MGRSNPNDPRYANNPDYSYKDGRWFYKGSTTPMDTTGDLPWKDPATGELVDPNTGGGVDPATAAEINRQAGDAHVDTPWDAVGNVFSGGIWGAANALGEPPPSAIKPGAPNFGVNGYGDPSGITQNQLGTDAPGAELDVNQSGADRTRMAGYLSQLQGQAQTGGGAWESALAANTHATQQSAQALSQTAGLDPMSAAMNAGNAEAGAAQRSVGQGNLLRAQTQQNARGQLADALGGQGAADAGEAAGVAGARQGVREANTSIVNAANKANQQTEGAIGQGFLSLLGMGGKAYGGEIGLSDGGKVPGTPEVFGDDQRNDTVPAKLSPGEIVIPISITSRPDAAQAAAAFVDAVKRRGARGSQQNFDGGGAVPPQGVGDASTLNPGGADSSVHERTAAQFLDIPLPQGPASTANGALLDTKNYDATRDANLSNSDALLAASRGVGPSTAPQAMQNAQDSTIAEAMRAQAGARHPTDVTGAATEQLQGGAGNAAGIVAGESQRAGEQFAQAVQRQRAQDLALATAKQQAAWRNSMLNAGVGIEQQNQLRNLLGAAGTGAVAVSGMFGAPSEGSVSSSDYSGGSHEGSGGEAPLSGDASGYGDYSVGEGGYAADGGIIVTRKGTRTKPTRPGATRKGDEPRGLNTVTSESNATPDEWAPFEGRRERRDYGTQYEDSPVQQFADGGQINFDGPSLWEQILGGPVSHNAPGSVFGPAVTPAILAQQDAAKADLAAKQQGERAMSPSLASLPPSKPEAPPVVAAQKPGPMPAKPLAAKATLLPNKSAAEAPPDQYALERQGAEQKAAADAGLAAEQATALEGAQRIQERAAIDQQQRAMRADADTASALNDIRKTSEDLRRVDTEVDTGKFWKDRGVPGKILASIGLILGAIGNDNGQNRAANMLNQLVDRDIDAQKASHEMALKKGQAAVEGAQTYYSLMRQKGLDETSAALAAKDLALDGVANQIQLAAARAGAPMAKAALTKALGSVAERKAANEQQLAQSVKADRLKWYSAQTDRMQAEAQAGKTVAQNPTQQAYLAQVDENRAIVKRATARLKELIKTDGTTGGLTGPASKEMNGLINDIALSQAKMNDPSGQAKQAEVDAIAKTFFQPGFFQRADTAIRAIDAFDANSEARKNAAFAARKQGDVSALVGATREAGGKKYRREADGWHQVSP